MLYRIARFVLEGMGMWKFPDERPLDRDEVVNTVLERGEVVHEQLLFPLILTQHLVVARTPKGFVGSIRKGSSPPIALARSRR